ncbi:MAG: nitrite reductase (NAD(P)H) small subunit [Elusimicrobiota bacterium]|jgi:nitrite reductase/ring-hydroxylating ferredoxin subunit
MADWENLCLLSDIPAGERKLFPLGALDIIVFNIGKRLYASAAECPLLGHNLLDADLQGHVARCKEDGCKVDLADGRCVTEAEMSIPVFPVEVRDGSVWVKF